MATPSMALIEVEAEMIGLHGEGEFGNELLRFDINAENGAFVRAGGQQHLAVAPKADVAHGAAKIDFLVHAAGWMQQFHGAVRASGYSYEAVGGDIERNRFSLELSAADDAKGGGIGVDEFARRAGGGDELRPIREKSDLKNSFAEPMGRNKREISIQNMHTIRRRGQNVSLVGGRGGYDRSGWCAQRNSLEKAEGGQIDYSQRVLAGGSDKRIA